MLRIVRDLVINRSMIDGHTDHGVGCDVLHPLAAEIYDASITQTRFIFVDRSQPHDLFLVEFSTPVPVGDIFESCRSMSSEARPRTQSGEDTSIRPGAHGRKRRGSPGSMLSSV